MRSAGSATARRQRSPATRSPPRHRPCTRRRRRRTPAVSTAPSSNQPAEHGRERRDDEHRGGGDAADPRLDHAVLHDCCQQLLVGREVQRSDRVDGRQRVIERLRKIALMIDSTKMRISRLSRQLAGPERPPRDVADRPPAFADAGEQRCHVVHGAEENAANHDPQPHRLPSEGERRALDPRSGQRRRSWRSGGEGHAGASARNPRRRSGDRTAWLRIVLPEHPATRR